MSESLAQRQVELMERRIAFSKKLPSVELRQEFLELYFDSMDFHYDAGFEEGERTRDEAT